MMTQEATIRRGVRNARYAAIPNHVFEDSRLSMEARWLLGYLLSKPDNWTVVQGDIIKKGGCGRDKARKMISELIDAGYAVREDQSRDGGKFSSSVLVIFDEPRAEVLAGITDTVATLPQTDLPATTQPSTVLPSPVKSAHSNNLPLAKTEYNNLREGVRERDEDRLDPIDQRKIDDAFWRVVKGWPDSAGMPKDGWKREWTALSQEERGEAERLRDAWLELIGKKRQHIPVPGTYFREKLWKDVPAIQEAAAPANVPAKPYGKLWGAARIAELAAGPTGKPTPPTTLERSLMAQGRTTLDALLSEKRMKMGWPSVNSMHERARDGKGTLCPLALEEAAHRFQQVHRDSDLLKAWLAEHRRRNWPIFATDRAPDWIYFPMVDPNETDLDLAVSRALDAFLDDISDFLRLRRQGDDHAG